MTDPATTFLITKSKLLVVFKATLIMHLVISTSSAAVLLLLLPPYVLPSSLSGIPFSECPTAPSISLIVAGALFAGHSTLDAFLGSEAFPDGSTVCGVDAVLWVV